jgi:choline dehydrogenase
MEELGEFDYIVVGAGSAGCIVAGELAQDPSLRVLVVEAGDAAEANPETLAAAGYKKAFINDALMYDRYSEPQRECKQHRLFMGTGRGVGGSGAINAMVYTRGDALDYEMWNADGWRWRDVVPAFEALEKKLRVQRRPPTAWTEACIAAAEESGFRRKDDLNDGSLCGFLGYEWMNYDGDRRRHSYAAFLQPLVGRASLTLLTKTLAQKILFDGERRAVGIELLVDGKLMTARARREIVLTAGALESPKLLMLSGIGPARESWRHGIAPLVDLPVGENLADHPNVQLFFAGKRPTDCNWAQLYGFQRANAASDLPAGAADTCYVFYSARSSLREGVIRLVPAMALPPNLYAKEWARDGLRSLLKLAFAPPPVARAVSHVWGIVVILGKPKSRGVVTLRSRNAADHAVIDPRYFSVAEDLQTMVKAVRLAREVAKAPPLRAWGNLPLMVPFGDGDERVGDFIRQNVMTTYHFTGTCRLGDVVDERLRVRGVRGLRVADASIIPSAPVSAMNAPSMLVGWRAAEWLRQDARPAEVVSKSTSAPPPA